jgi:hypothetical protein
MRLTSMQVIPRMFSVKELHLCYTLDWSKTSGSGMWPRPLFSPATKGILQFSTIGTKRNVSQNGLYHPVPGVSCSSRRIGTGDNKQQVCNQETARVSGPSSSLSSCRPILPLNTAYQVTNSSLLRGNKNKCTQGSACSHMSEEPK